jgi:hypothetical protein
MPFQLVRTYRFRPGATSVVARSVERELAPRLRQQPGFLTYRLLTTADDRAVSVSTWVRPEEAILGDVVEAEWVRDAITDELAALPDVFVGQIVVEI